MKQNNKLKNMNMDLNLIPNHSKAIPFDDWMCLIHHRWHRPRRFTCRTQSTDKSYKTGVWLRGQNVSERTNESCFECIPLGIAVHIYIYIYKYTTLNTTFFRFFFIPYVCTRMRWDWWTENCSAMVCEGISVCMSEVWSLNIN